MSRLIEAIKHCRDVNTNCNGCPYKDSDVTFVCNSIGKFGDLDVEPFIEFFELEKQLKETQELNKKLEAEKQELICVLADIYNDVDFYSSEVELILNKHKQDSTGDKEEENAEIK